MELSSYIRSINDFPEPGIVFRDITPVLQNPETLVSAVDQVADTLSGLDFDLIIGPESRGFIFGVPVAYKLKKGFVPIRKAGKLPHETISKQYALEYGSATIEIHKDAVKPGQRVVVIDDLLATGGTCAAIVELIEQLGGTVVCLSFLIELAALQGRDLLKKYNVASILQY